MRTLKKALIFGAVIPFFLSGCENNSSKKNSEILTELTDISKVGESFDDEIEKLKESEFDNISFADLNVYSFPEIDAVYSLNVVQNSNGTADELYKFMCEKIDELMPDKYTDEQKLNEICFVDCGYFDENARQFPNYRQYKENGLETETPWLLFDVKENYFDVVNDGLRVYNSGAAVKRGDNDRKTLDYYYLTGKYDVVLYTEDMGQEKSFELQGGELSIDQAREFADNYLENERLFLYDRGINFCTDGVKVLDMKNGKYGYVFSIVGKYKGMKFSGADARNSETGITFVTNSTNEIGRPGTFCVTEKGKVDYFDLVMIYDAVEEETYTSIVPLNKAAELASESLTPGISFSAERITAVYKEFSNKPSNGYSDPQEYSDRSIFARPCWRFTLRPTTGNTDRLYFVFVDMITGKVDYLTQNFPEIDK